MEQVAAERRRFLENCGKFAVVTPPTVALMLSAPGSVRAALAASGGTTGASVSVSRTTISAATTGGASTLVCTTYTLGGK